MRYAAALEQHVELLWIWEEGEGLDRGLRWEYKRSRGLR